jgi:hypothetical protein
MGVNDRDRSVLIEISGMGLHEQDRVKWVEHQLKGKKLLF